MPAELFAGFGYVALGHLHGQQTLAPHLRYSGSPLPYSFSEASHRKGSWLVELDAAGAARAEQVPAPAYRRLSVLRGRLADLLGSAAYAAVRGRLRVRHAHRPEPPRGQRWTRCAPASRTSWCSRSSLRASCPTQRGYRARTAGRDDLAIAAEFVRHVSNAPPTAGERNGCSPARSRPSATDEAAG